MLHLLHLWMLLRVSHFCTACFSMIYKTQGKQNSSLLEVPFCLNANNVSFGKDIFVSLLCLALSTLAVLTKLSGWVFFSSILNILFLPHYIVTFTKFPKSKYDNFSIFFFKYGWNKTLFWLLNTECDMFT